MNKIVKRVLLCVIYYGIIFSLAIYLKNENLIEATPYSLLGVSVAVCIPIAIFEWKSVDGFWDAFDITEVIFSMVMPYCISCFYLFLYPDTSLPFHSYSKAKLILIGFAAVIVLFLIIGFLVTAILSVMRVIYSFFKKDKNENQSEDFEDFKFDNVANSVVHNSQDAENDDYDKVVDVPISQGKD